ncbi:MAG: RidA family protein [Bradymonadaceae bacterium]
MSAEKKFIVETEEAPRAIGPYSQAVGYNGMLFLSGQIGLEPDSGDLVEGGLEAEIEQVMENLESVLRAAGVNFSHVIRTTIYLDDMGDFETVNEIYGSYFDANPPARATVEVSELPRGASVEVDLVAARPPIEEEAEREE